eukprot:gene11777-14989_t
MSTNPNPSVEKKALTAAEAAKQVRRTIIEMVDGKTADGQPAKVPKEKQVSVSAAEVLDFAERDATRTPDPGMALKLIPPGTGFARLTEAVTTEYGQLVELVRQALAAKVRNVPGMSEYYVNIQGIWPDRVVANLR